MNKATGKTQRKHLAGEQCPSCRKLTYCEHCAACESCNFKPQPVAMTGADCPNRCGAPYCEHCKSHKVHARTCPLAMLN